MVYWWLVHGGSLMGNLFNEWLINGYTWIIMSVVGTLQRLTFSGWYQHPSHHQVLDKFLENLRSYC